MGYRIGVLGLVLYVLATPVSTADSQSVDNQQWRILSCATTACDVGCKFLPALMSFTPIPQAQTVIRTHVIGGRQGRSHYNGCTMTDAKNWSCHEATQGGHMQPTHRMIDGTPSVIGGTASQQNGSYICYQRNDQ